MDLIVNSLSLCMCMLCGEMHCLRSILQYECYEAIVESHEKWHSCILLQMPYTAIDTKQLIFECTDFIQDDGEYRLQRLTPYLFANNFRLHRNYALQKKIGKESSSPCTISHSQRTLFNRTFLFDSIVCLACWKFSSAYLSLLAFLFSSFLLPLIHFLRFHRQRSRV